MTTPSYIFFDLDNTLLDHSSAEAAAQQETYKTFSLLKGVTFDEWISTYRTINSKLWGLYQQGKVNRDELQRRRFEESMTTLGLNGEKWEQIGAAYMELYREHWNWIDGAEEALAQISERFPSGIITNGFRETQMLKFEKMQLNRYCRDFLISEDVGVMKPHPKVFDRGTDMAGVDRSAILYVGDSFSSDIIGGRSAGWGTAWYTAFANGEELSLDESAEFHFDDFSELLNRLVF